MKNTLNLFSADQVREPRRLKDELRFYTLPPKGVPHEYIVVNPKSFNQLSQRDFSHAICDSGVHFFYENPTAKDYPAGYLESYLEKARYLASSFGDKVWVTIPDYPDDYHPGQFGDNVQKTLENVERFSKITGINWMPTIQSSYRSVSSFEYCCKEFQRMGDFERIAIGTVCKIRDVEFIIRCCRTARKFFPKAWIHAFGPPLNVVPSIRYFVNSFDSAAWTFPRKPHYPSCKTAEERRKYFFAFKCILEEKLEFNNTSILDFV